MSATVAPVRRRPQHVGLPRRQRRGPDRQGGGGRLPRRCTPQRCELVLVGGRGRLPRLPFLHVVGRGTLTKDAPLAAYFGNRGANGPPLLLAEGALALGRAPLPDAELIARTYGWVLPIAPGSLHDWEIPGLARRVDREAVRLAAVDPVFSVTAPLDSLAFGAREGARRGRAAPADRRRRRRAVARVRRPRSRAAAARHRRRAAASDVVGSALVAARDVHGRRARARRLRRGLRRLGRGRRLRSVAGALVDTDAGPVLAHSLLSGHGLALAVAARRRLGGCRRRVASCKRRVVRGLVAHDRGRRCGRRDRGGAARRCARRCERGLRRRRHRRVPAAAAGARRLRGGGARGAAARARLPHARPRTRAAARAARRGLARAARRHGDRRVRVPRRQRRRRALRRLVPRHARARAARPGRVRGARGLRAVGEPRAPRPVQAIAPPPSRGSATP